MIGQLNRLKAISNLYKTSVPENARANIISFISGKGGTGKSTVSLNTAKVLADRGLSVLLIDMDLRMPNLHLLLNITHQYSIGDYFENICSFNDLIYTHCPGLNFILGDSGDGNMMTIEDYRITPFMHKIVSASENYDFIFLDNPAGIGTEVRESAQISDSKIIVATPEATAVMDAYVIVKYLESIDSNRNVGVVMNKCNNEAQGKKAFGNLDQAVGYFLNSDIEYLAALQKSDIINKAVLNQDFVFNLSSKSPITFKIKEISTRISQNNHLANNSQSISARI